MVVMLSSTTVSNFESSPNEFAEYLFSSEHNKFCRPHRNSFVFRPFRGHLFGAKLLNDER